MKHKDDNLEWHDENELVRRLDVVEAVLNLADTIDDVVDVIMSVPTYKVQTNTNIAMGSDSISTKADRKTEPQTDCKMPYEDCEDCETHLKAQYGDCNKCKWYGDKQVCGRCRSRNLYAPKDEPQTEEYEEPNYYDPALWE